MDTAFTLLLSLAEQCAGPGAGGVLLNSLSPNGMLRFSSADVLRSLQQQFRPPANPEHEHGQQTGRSPLLQMNEERHSFDTLVSAKGRQHNPFLTYIIQHTIAHLETCKDGGWTLVGIAGELFRALCAADYCSSFQQRLTAEIGLNVLRRWLSELFAEPNSPSASSRKPWIGYLTAAQYPSVVRSNVKGMLRWSAGLGETPTIGKRILLEEEHLVKLILSAFWVCVDESGPKAFPGRLKYHVLCGEVTQSRLVPGIVLDWQLPLEAQLLLAASANQGGSSNTSLKKAWKERKEHAALLFSCALDDSLEVAALVLAAVSHLDISFVASQRTISPRLRELLFERDVLALERLSIQYISTFAMATGAKPISSVAMIESSWTTLQSSHAGKLLKVDWIEIGDKRMMHLLTPLHLGFSTLLLATPIAAHQVAFVTAVQRCLETLFSLFANPFVVAGGGATELFAVEYVSHRWALSHREYCASSSERERRRAAKRRLWPVVMAFREAVKRYLAKVVVGKDSQVVSCLPDDGKCQNDDIVGTLLFVEESMKDVRQQHAFGRVVGLVTGELPSGCDLPPSWVTQNERNVGAQVEEHRAVFCGFPAGSTMPHRALLPVVSMVGSGSEKEWTTVCFPDDKPQSSRKGKPATGTDKQESPALPLMMVAPLRVKASSLVSAVEMLSMLLPVDHASFLSAATSSGSAAEEIAVTYH